MKSAGTVRSRAVMRALTVAALTTRPALLRNF
jgi:hypothetical protein